MGLYLGSTYIPAIKVNDGGSSSGTSDWEDITSSLNWNEYFDVLEAKSDGNNCYIFGYAMSNDFTLEITDSSLINENTPCAFLFSTLAGSDGPPIDSCVAENGIFYGSNLTEDVETYGGAYFTAYWRIIWESA